MPRARRHVPDADGSDAYVIDAYVIDAYVTGFGVPSPEKSKAVSPQATCALPR